MNVEDNNMKKLLALALVLVLIFSLCACGSGSGKSLAGTWTLIGLKSGGVDYTEMLKTSGVSIVLQLNADGTGYIDFGGGDKEDFTWSGTTITSDGSRIPFTVDGDTLTISQNGEEMVFTRK